MHRSKGKLRNNLIVMAVVFFMVIGVTYFLKWRSSMYYSKSVNDEPFDSGRNSKIAWQKPISDDLQTAEPITNVPSDMESRKTSSSGPQPLSSLLHEDNFPKNVFYVWCGVHYFEFQNYVSVLSAIKSLQPDNIFFLHEHEPRSDRRSYYTWFEELQETFPFLHLRKVDSNDNPCDKHGNIRQTPLFKILTHEGGVYIHITTVIMQSLHKWRNQSVINALDPTTWKGFLAAKPGAFQAISDRTNATSGHPFDTRMLNCANRRHASASKDDVTVCLNIDGTLYPNEIWESDDMFDRTIREICYGNASVVHPEKSYDDLAPNIVHFIWIGGGKMNFQFYLGVLSAIYVAEVDRVYIHGDMPPTGEYWDGLVNHDRVTFIRRLNAGVVYGHQVADLSHVSDVWRVDIMIKYGGIYMDTDSALIRPLDRERRAYGALASFDCIVHNPFPNIINFGVTVGKRNSRFWREFQKSMKLFKDGDWLFNGVCQPYTVKERYPALLQIDPHLQIICYKDRCHPTYWPNWEDQSVHHLNSNSIQNWRNDSFAFHWTYPVPNEFRSERNLLTANTMFAEIGKYILRKAGKLK